MVPGQLIDLSRRATMNCSKFFCLSLAAAFAGGLVYGCGSNDNSSENEGQNGSGGLLGSTRCVPNETQSCLGVNNCRGSQGCRADGSRWEVCTCLEALTGTGGTNQSGGGGGTAAVASTGGRSGASGGAATGGLAASVTGGGAGGTTAITGGTSNAFGGQKPTATTGGTAPATTGGAGGTGGTSVGTGAAGTSGAPAVHVEPTSDQFLVELMGVPPSTSNMPTIGMRFTVKDFENPTYAMTISDFSLRYWVNGDGASNLDLLWEAGSITSPDFAANSARQVYTGISGSLNGCRYIEIKFYYEWLGKKFPITFPLRLRENFGNMPAVQANDWSYDTSAPLNEYKPTKRITVYYKGKLIYGIEPPNDGVSSWCEGV